MSKNWFDDLLGFVAPSAPLAFVWIVGCIWALVTYRKHPGVSLTALCGCLVLILNIVGGSLLTWWMFEQRKTGAWNTPELNLTMSMLSLARGCVSMAGYLLLLVAVFGWRPAPMPPRRKPEVEPLDEVPDVSPTGIRKSDSR